MSSSNLLDEYLDSPIDWARINNLGNYIFKEGHLDSIDDMIVLILPIINVVYYKQIRWLDDRFYAKEDLLQDSIIEIYNDMKMHWDKYIEIDNYPKYFEKIARNVMINAVHKHHSYYSNVELNCDLNYNTNNSQVSYDLVETNMIRSNINSDILNMTRRLASFRGKYSKVLDLLITEIYDSDSPELDSLRSKLRVLGVTDSLYKMLYNHVLYLHKLSYNYQKCILKGNRRMELRIKDIISRYEDPTYEILVNSYSDSIIPEIYAEFGSDFTRKFVRTFSGQEVVVPEYQDFCDTLFGGTIYSIAKGDRSNLYRFASDNGFSFRTVARIFDKVAKFYEKKSNKS